MLGRQLCRQARQPRLLIIPGAAAQGFWRHLDRVVDLGLDWLGRYLPPQAVVRS